MSKLCPCTSGLEYDKCCEPYLTGSLLPQTAEQLMRSRYTAYAVCDIDYLYKTSGEGIKKDFDFESSRKWAQSAVWLGMEVVATEKGTENDNDGIVEFIAHYRVKESDFAHHERATFQKINGEWFFIDGEIITAEPIRRESPKIGRNDPCPCGSGKKYKKCCGI